MEIKRKIVDTSMGNKYKTMRWKVAQWFELRWWKNYFSNKSKQEYLIWKKNYWEKILLNVSEVVSPKIDLTVGQNFKGSLGIFRNKNILDLGCGPSGIYTVLSESKVVAVDPLLRAYENETSFFKMSDYPSTTFCNEPMEDFVSNDFYDFVFCMNAINHVSSIGQGFEKIVQLCAKDGFVVVSVDAHNYASLKSIFRFIPGDILHPHQYDLEEYESFLNKRDLRILNTSLLKQEFFFNHYLIIARKC